MASGKDGSDTDERQSENRPRIVLPWSLRQQCLDEIRRSVLRWSKSQDGSEPSTPASPVEDNPFVDCPLHVRQDLLASIVDDEERSPALRRIAELLLVSGLESFDLGCLDDFGTKDLQFILDLLQEHGGALRELTIAGLWMYSPECGDIVRRLLSSAPNLRVLRIQDMVRSDLEILARSCPRLQRLEVMHPSINAEDIAAFVRTVRQGNLPIRDSIVEISLPASVDGEGVLALLEALPNVQILRCVYLEKVLDSVDARAIISPGVRAWWVQRLARIRGLQSGIPMGWDSVERLVVWFPELQEIVLHVQEGMSLRELAKLKKLRSLELRNSPTFPSSYTDDVLPTLALCGRRLLRLALEHFDVIDLGRTHVMCPQLESLCLQWFILLGCAMPSTQRGVASRPFQHLRDLRLRPRVGRIVQPEALELLLSNCSNLRQLEVFSGMGLNDALAATLCQTNGFPHLEVLRLRHGHGLSAEGLQFLLAGASELKSWNAGKLTKRPSLDEGEDEERDGVPAAGEGR